MVQTKAMWLVYVDGNGDRHFQPWRDVVSVGTLIDPDTGEDMETVGWTTEAPA